jgi:hypothetical protein
MASGNDAPSMLKNISNILLLPVPDEEVSIDKLLSGGTYPVSNPMFYYLNNINLLQFYFSWNPYAI